MLFLWFLFHIVAILMSFFVTVLFFLMWHMISFCQWMHNSQLGILTQYSENISHGSMGLQITGASQTGISTFTYLQYLCVYCHMCWCICQKKTCYFTLHVAVLSDQEHMTTKSESHREPWRATPLLYLRAAVGGRIIVYVSLFQSDQLLTCVYVYFCNWDVM